MNNDNPTKPDGERSDFEIVKYHTNGQVSKEWQQETKESNTSQVVDQNYTRGLSTFLVWI